MRNLYRRWFTGGIYPGADARRIDAIRDGLLRYVLMLRFGSTVYWARFDVPWLAAREFAGRLSEEEA